MPRVSVIIPTQSRPHLLQRAVESAQQAGLDVEVIVLDDASTDTTREVCQKLKGIKYIRLDRNQGVAGARNVGILASLAEYVSFLDDDDQRLPGSLDLQLEALAANPEAGFVCGPVLYADEDGHPTGEIAYPKGSDRDVFWEVLEWNFFILPVAVVIRKDCFFRVGLFNSRLAGVDDWDLWVRLAELFPVAIVSQPVGIYREPTPFSIQGSSNLSPHFFRAARQQLQHLQLPRSLDASASQRDAARKRTLNRYADTLMWKAARWLPEGAYRFAWMNFWAALRLSPLRIFRPGPHKLLVKGFLKRWRNQKEQGRLSLKSKLIIKP